MIKFNMWTWSLILYFSYTESSILPHLEDTYSILQSVRQHSFLKDKFHYLNVSQIGSFILYDIFDCTFECLSNPSCLSVNMAASKGANGDVWCELLSSDKYRNSTEYKRNKSSHHFSIRVGNIAWVLTNQWCVLLFLLLMVCFALFCFVILSVTATSCGTKNTDNYYNGDDDQKMTTTIKLLLAVLC